MSSGDNVRRKKQRLRLFKVQAGLCYWCQGPMRMKDNGTVKGGWQDGATIDHLHHRGHPLRGTVTATNVCTHVLACKRCNSERGIQAWLPAERASINTGESHG